MRYIKTIPSVKEEDLLIKILITKEKSDTLEKGGIKFYNLFKDLYRRMLKEDQSKFNNRIVKW